MASYWYDHAAYLVLNGALNFASGGNDIRVALVMTNTTADTEKDKALMNAFTTLDEYDGANYVRKSLTESLGEDNTNHRGEFDATDITWTALGAGTRNCQGAIIYKHVTNDTDSIPLAWLDSGGFPFTGNGGDVTITWNAEGVLQAQA